MHSIPSRFNLIHTLTLHFLHKIHLKIILPPMLRLCNGRIPSNCLPKFCIHFPIRMKSDHKPLQQSLTNMVNILYWSLHNLLLHFRMEVDTMFSTCDIVCKVIPAQVLLEVIQAVQQICSLPDKVFQSLYLHIANGKINFVPNHFQ